MCCCYVLACLLPDLSAPPDGGTEKLLDSLNICLVLHATIVVLCRLPFTVAYSLFLRSKMELNFISSPGTRLLHNGALHEH
jgi:hypothetical protein